MEIEVVDRRALSESDARAIAELLCLVWPKPDSDLEMRAASLRGNWAEYCGSENQFPRSFVLQSSGQVVGHAELGPRTIGTSRGDVTIGALAGVCIHPDFRARGLGRRLVRAAFELIDNGVYPFALFQNYMERRAFYEHLGAKVIEQPIVNSLAENGRINPFWADVAMVYPASKAWPPGEIDLRGPGY